MKFVLAAVLLLATPCEALSKARSSRASTTEAMEAFQQAEAEDLRFWSSEFSSLEEELKQLASLANATVVAAAKSNATNASVVLAANATAQVSNVSSETKAVKPVKKHHEAPLIPKHMNLNPKSLADLAPALAMLKGLYEDGKDRIAKLNVREKDGKKKFEEKVKQHNDRIATIEGRFKNHTLSLEFRTNETRDENRLWSYWSRVRERQHKQYHTGLKIQHATLDKVKKMIDMYEKTMSGDTKGAKKELEQVSPPEIVFLQEDVVHFCKESLTELQASRSELRSIAPPREVAAGRMEAPLI